MPSLIDENDPAYDLPEPTAPGEFNAWALEALNRVLQTRPERLDWREVDNAAQDERRSRMMSLSTKSARAPRPIPAAHAELDRLMDEYFDPPTASALPDTSPRSEASIEMESI